jgi:hypothetical protein
MDPIKKGSSKPGTIQPGEVRNPKGRPPGIVNRTNKEMKEFISIVLSENLDRMREDFDKVSPGTRLMLWDRFAKYILPTLSQTQIDGDITGKVEVIVKYSDEKNTDD